MRVDYINNRAQVEELLKKYVKGERFTHSLGTEKTAILLAKRYGADVSKAGLAGLLHDITKQMDNRALAERYGIDAVVEKTLHGPTAASWLKEQGIVADEEVLCAIRYHTTGRADMTLLEKIIYLADYMEPERDFPGVEKLREYAEEDIDKAVLYGLQMSLANIVEKKSLIDMDSVAAYNCYRKLVRKEAL